MFEQKRLLFDCAQRIRKDLLWFLIDGFVLERPHLTTKDVAEVHVKNTSRYEKSVLAGVLNVQCRLLKSLTPTSALLDASVAPVPGYPSAVLADNMQVRGMHISVGDVVLNGTSAGQVLACIQEGDSFFCIAQRMTMLERITPESFTFSVTDERVVWSALRVERVL